MNEIDNIGKIYIVATPIGNLADITERAITTLKKVDVILAEDTRHSKILLSKLGIQKPLMTLHDHNERQEVEKWCSKVLQGKTLALISDAGTPLISDPGYSLVRNAQDRGITVVPIPGPSAIITALCASGLPTDQFIFSGFLPAKANARRARLESLKFQDRTLIFFEAPHRILQTLTDMMNIFGEAREAVLARELTKAFETIRRVSLVELLEWVKNDKDQTRGEMVLLVAGLHSTKLSAKPLTKSLGRQKDEISTERSNPHSEETSESISEEVLRMLKFALEELPPKRAVILISKISGVSKQLLYDWAVKLKR